MPKRSNIRPGLTGTLLLIIAALPQGCSEAPTALHTTTEECVWIDGQIHCWGG